MPCHFRRTFPVALCGPLTLLLAACGGTGTTPDEPCTESPAGSGYCLIWQDEFQAASLDVTKWSVERNCWGGGNDEAQCYVDDPENLWLDGEYLNIRALAQSAVGPSLPEDDPGYDPDDTSGSGTFTSARIRTKNKGEWRYGRFEIRAQLPQGQGTWPAIWMLPTDSPYGGWAASGEIDIMEAVNLKVGGENRVHGTLHYGAQWPNNVYEGVAYPMPEANPADDFHIYALEWEQGEIRWYVDGEHYATQTEAGWYSNAALANPTAPFDEHFHLILNLAVGGAWAGQVNDTGIDVDAFPQSLLVDYVRVYECSVDPLTGRGCATRGTGATTPPGHTPPQPPDTGGDTLTIFDGNVYAPFQWLTYTTNGTVDYRLLELAEPQGAVAEIEFATSDGIGFFQAPSGVDLRDYTRLEFQWRVLEDPRGELAAYSFRADCTYPCTSGDRALTPTSFGRWQIVEIPLAELAQAGLDLAAVNTPFVIGPSGSAEGAVIQVDDIRLLK